MRTLLEEDRVLDFLPCSRFAVTEIVYLPVVSAVFLTKAYQAKAVDILTIKLHCTNNRMYQPSKRPIMVLCSGAFVFEPTSLVLSDASTYTPPEP